MDLMITKRLRLRQLQASDGEPLLAMQNDEEILRYNVMAAMTQEKMSRWIEEHQKEDTSLVVERSDTEQVIGMIHLEQDQLRHRANSLCVSYYLKTNQVGQGFMYEALVAILYDCFERRGLDLVSARVFAPNERSHRLLKRLGFVREGILKQAVRAYRDILYDDYLYRMTKEEFRLIFPEKREELYK